MTLNKEHQQNIRWKTTLIFILPHCISLLL